VAGSAGERGVARDQWQVEPLRKCHVCSIVWTDVVTEPPDPVQDRLQRVALDLDSRIDVSDLLDVLIDEQSSSPQFPNGVRYFDVDRMRRMQNRLLSKQPLEDLPAFGLPMRRSTSVDASTTADGIDDLIRSFFAAFADEVCGGQVTQVQRRDTLQTLEQFIG
jgi:hypothetical protein